MTNDELKAFLIDCVAIRGLKPGNSDRIELFREVLDKLKSGHIYVGEWREDVDNAPRDTPLLRWVNDGWQAVELGWDNVWRACVEGRVERVARYTSFPAPPKVKP